MSDRFEDQFRPIVEVVLLAAEGPVAVDELVALAATESDMSTQELRDAVRRVIAELATECEGRGVQLREVASGFRYQVREEYARWVARFLGERPARYSRALLETLALIAYRQPITRGEIEDVRGVGVSTSIMRTLHEREWIRVLAHRDVPGRPALYGVTRKFLDDFGLKSIEELPALDPIRDVQPADLFPAGDLGAKNGSGTQALGPGPAGGREDRSAGAERAEDGSPEGESEAAGE
ncbi:MAG: SMC-Scp complex subunit ScpB [Immundisolibacterales bacterium]|nr:SMC-Scp complex subunit ScpB [Immundisolibacterales bacterium]